MLRMPKYIEDILNGKKSKRENKIVKWIYSMFKRDKDKSLIQRLLDKNCKL